MMNHIFAGKERKAEQYNINKDMLGVTLRG